VVSDAALEFEAIAIQHAQFGKSLFEQLHESGVVFDQGQPLGGNATEEKLFGDGAGTRTQFQNRPGPIRIDLCSHGA